MTARTSVLALAVVAGVLSGCTSGPEATQIPSPEATANPDFFFPQRPAPPPGQLYPVLLAAPMRGTLTFEDGCIWLRSAEGRHLILWGHEHSAGWFDGRIVILESGQAVARTGDAVAIGGGEWSRQDVPQVDDLVEAKIGAMVPPLCRSGLYWQAGGVQQSVPG